MKSKTVVSESVIGNDVSGDDRRAFLRKLQSSRHVDHSARSGTRAVF